MSEKFLKVGVLGFGGRVNGLQKWCMIHKVENFKVTAVMDPNVEMSKQRIEETPEIYEGCRIYTDADEMLEKEELDGVFVGSLARWHVELAEKVMKKGLPLFLEKPVAVEWEDLHKLNELRKKYNPKCIVSFPLRYSPMSQKIRQIIEAGELGRIEQVQAWNDIAYGRVYHHSKHIYKETSGELWLEKATHDLDLINYYVGELPEKLCAMESKNLFPYDPSLPRDLKCADCDRRTECPESDYAVEKVYQDEPHGPYCCYSIPEDEKQHDCGTVIAKYPSGLHAMYSQNTFVRFHAGRRGGRIYGYKATLEYDINNAEIKIYHHDFDTVDTMKFHGITDPHCGGDQVLMPTFAAMMRGKEVPNTLLEGIQSAAYGLVAAESCKKDEYLPVPTME